VPYAEAFALDDVERAAWVIIFRQFEGDVFDWDAGQWKERK
jgi:hypothetical protein